MSELTKLQRQILKQSDYDLKEWLVDAFFAAERRHNMAKLSMQAVGHETDIEWYARRMSWLKRFIKLIEEEKRD